MTSQEPRTLLGWTVPDHMNVLSTSKAHHVTCRHLSHEGGFPGRIFTVYEEDLPTLVGHWVRDHAHIPVPASESAQDAPVPISAPVESGNATGSVSGELSAPPRLPREELGKRVCEVALAWSREDDDRPGATAAWDQLTPEFQELHMRVGEALFGLGMTWSPAPGRIEWGFRDIGSDNVRIVPRRQAERAAVPGVVETVCRLAGPWEVVS